MVPTIKGAVMTGPLRPTDWYPIPSGAPVGVAAPQPKNDPFYKYTASKPLADIAPGTVLKTRSVPYHVFGIPTLLKTTQLLYRSTSQTGDPTVNVTSVIQPPNELLDAEKVISYQSAYDSLNQNDEPSYSISGGFRLRGMIIDVEAGVFGPFLADGYTVIVPDTEGQEARFAAVREYGHNTLDSIRAAFNSPTVGLPSDAKVAMLGYSGGAIATEWAAELAPRYAPDVNARLIGAAMGGVLVHPARNLHYVDGSLFWPGVMPMALVGLGRAFKRDFRNDLSGYGVQLHNKLRTASIIDVLGHYPGLTWRKLAKPAYPTPEKLPFFAVLANQLIMGTGDVPTIPLFIGQGANGAQWEGTPGDKPDIGPGDGVMIAGDVRTLARDYCKKGTTVHYEQYDSLSHIWSIRMWVPNAIAWIKERFAGLPAPQNCSSIKPGNKLPPIQVPSSADSART